MLDLNASFKLLRKRGSLFFPEVGLLRKSVQLVATILQSKRKVLI